MVRRITAIFLMLAGVCFGTQGVIYAMMCHGQAGGQQIAQHEHPEDKNTKQDAVAVAMPQAAVNVGNKICPVSGEEVGQGGMEPVTYEYEGKIYNFCCTACIEEFKKDPEKYIKKVEEELQSEPKGQPEHEGHETEMMQGTGASPQGTH